MLKKITIFLLISVLAFEKGVGQDYSNYVISVRTETHFQAYYNSAIVKNNVSSVSFADFTGDPEKSRLVRQIYFYRNGYQAKEWYYDGTKKHKLTIKDSFLLDVSGLRYELCYTAFKKAPYVKTIKYLTLEEEKDYLAHPEKFKSWMDTGFRFVKFVDGNYYQQREYSWENDKPVLVFAAKFDSVGNVLNRITLIGPSDYRVLFFEYDYQKNKGFSYYYKSNSQKYLYSIIELNNNNQVKSESVFNMEFTPDIFSQLNENDAYRILEYDIRENGLIDQVRFLEKGMPTRGIVYTYEYFHD